MNGNENEPIPFNPDIDKDYEGASESEIEVYYAKIS